MANMWFLCHCYSNLIFALIIFMPLFYSNFIFALLDKLHQHDHNIHMLCEDKMNVALEILDVFAKDDLSGYVSK